MGLRPSIGPRKGARVIIYSGSCWNAALPCVGLRSGGADGDLDPFVFQVYKSATVMLFSVLLLAIRHQEYVYCSQPIYGCLMWVPGGVFAIVAVQTAGLGISTALWSSASIITSFCCFGSACARVSRRSSKR